MLEVLFGTNKPVIGVIHLLPLPGSPGWDGQLEPVLLRAEQEAAALATGGVNGIIIENFFDAPFTNKRVDTATACAMALAAKRVMVVSHVPIGINVLRNDGLSALSIASTVGAQFIRVNVFTGAMVTDQGIIEGCAHELLMSRRQLGAEVKILADVMVKHANPLAATSTIAQMAHDAVYRGKADGVIVSGKATGSAPSLEDLIAVREAVPGVPVFIGSGADKTNIATLLRQADGVIVASSLKRQGVLENPVDVEKERSVVRAAPTTAKLISGVEQELSF